MENSASYYTEKYIYKTCCFTGHREILPGQLAILAGRLEETIKALVQQGVTHFWCGGALGFDTLAAKAVLKLCQEYPHIKLCLALPCRSQTRRWGREDIETYEAIRAAADQVVYTAEEYIKGCMHRRNRYLVDHSSVCVCYLMKNTGGTAYTVNYARKKGVPIIHLDTSGKESSMEIERKYYTEALRRMEEEGDDREEMKRMLSELGPCMERHPPVPNAEKQQWFEDLTERVLEFARVCELDVKLCTTKEHYGIIEFESSLLELTWSEPPEIHEFWLYLCSKGQLRISHYLEFFRIEFLFALFDDE